MNILQISIQAPGYNSGGTLGILQFSYALTRNNKVTYIGPKIESEDIEPWFEKTIYMSRKLTLVEKLQSLLHMEFDKYYILWNKIDINFNDYDAIYIDFTRWQYVVKSIKKSGYKGKIIVRAHNVEKDYLRVEYKSQRTISSYIKSILAGHREKYMVNDVDVVACAFDTFLDGSEPNQNYDTSSYTTLFIQGGNSAIESMISADKSVSVRGFVWNKIYKRKLLEKVKFDDNLIICEDSVFSWEIMKTAKTLQLVQVPLYHYRKRINSSTGSANFEKNYTAVEAYSRMIEDVVEKRVCLGNLYKKELFKQYIYWIVHTAESNGANRRKLSMLNKYVGLIPDTFEVEELSFEMRRKLIALKKSPDDFIRTIKMWSCYKNIKKSIKRIIKH